MILFVTIGWQNEKHYNVGDGIWSHLSGLCSIMSQLLHMQGVL